MAGMDSYFKPNGHRPGSRYSYADNGSSILAIAHTDTIHQDRDYFAVDTKSGLVICPHLDDRLGVHTILDYLPSLGVKFDTLLTEGEESFNSTAQLFRTKKQYNWVVEFDRRGTDAVLYDYDGDGWQKVVKQYFPIGQGSFSDISTLEVGCKALNVGIGYHNEHCDDSYMLLDEYLLQMARFLLFYEEQAENSYPHTHKPRVQYGYYGYGGFDWDNYLGTTAKPHNSVPTATDDDYWCIIDGKLHIECPDCLELFAEDRALATTDAGWLCPRCNCLVPGYKEHTAKAYTTALTAPKTYSQQLEDWHGPKTDPTLVTFETGMYCGQCDKELRLQTEYADYEYRYTCPDHGLIVIRYPNEEV